MGQDKVCRPPSHRHSNGLAGTITAYAHHLRFCARSKRLGGEVINSCVGNYEKEAFVIDWQTRIGWAQPSL
jgi:hypothetical protein